MNRRLTAFLTLAVLVTALGMSPALAQEKSPLHLGMKLGANISDFRGNEIEGAGELLDWKLGLCAGGYLSYTVNDWFTFQSELLYSMKGMKLGFLFESISFSLDYIEVPLLAMFNLPTDLGIKPFIYGGPVFGVNVRSELGVSFFDDLEVDLSKYVNTFEFSLALGAGLSVDIDHLQLIFDARYVPGLTNIFTDEVTESEDLDASALEWKNDTFSFLLGFGIGF